MGPITTPKNPISCTFYLHFSGFIYKSFSSSLLMTSATILSCPFSVSISLSIKAVTFPVLIKSLSNLFIIVWNIVGKLVSPKNITVSSKDPSGVVNTTFHSFFFFILMLLYPHLRSIFVKTFFVPVFSRMSDIRGSRIIVLYHPLVQILIVLYHLFLSILFLYKEYQRYL